MKRTLSLARRNELRRAVALALLSAGALQTFPTLHAADDAEVEAEAEAEAEEEAVDPASLRNWVDLSLGGTIVDGDPAAMRYRTGLPEGLYGGVSSFHYEADIDENTLLQIDGRGIAGNSDYSLSLDLNRYDLGYVRAGLSHFRRYTDGSGGYYPDADLWFEDLFDDELELDRSEYWVELGLRVPDIPELTLRYTRTERDGRKASTHWGDASLGPGLSRKITPAFLDLDETRDQISLDGRHYIGSTTLDLGVRYEKQKVDNSRNLRFAPGTAADAHATQREESDSDLFNVHGAGKSQLRDNLWLTLGYAYTDLNNDTAGYRVYGNGYDPDLANRIGSPFTYENLSGDGRISQHVANLNLYWNLANHLDLVPLVRFEQQSRDASSTYGAPAAPFTPTPYGTSSDRGLLDVAGGLELRYRGVTNVSFYARGDWLTGQGDLDETWENLVSGGNIVARSSDDERFWQKYSVGANWYPHRRFSLGGGYFYKLRENTFDHTADNTPNLPPSGNRYPAYLLAQDYALHDANARITWRPRLNLTLVARYDLQLGELQSEADGLGDNDTANITSQIGSLSVSWVPLSRLYLQARGSYVTDKTESDVTGFTTAVEDAKNDYWTATGVVGLALSDEVDLEGNYTYYQADNFNSNLVAGQPYGTDLEEHWLGASLTWRMTPRVRWLARYGFGSSTDDSSGGNNDFDVHMLQASVQYRF